MIFVILFSFCFINFSHTHGCLHIVECMQPTGINKYPQSDLHTHTLNHIPQIYPLELPFIDKSNEYVILHFQQYWSLPNPTACTHICVNSNHDHHNHYHHRYRCTSDRWRRHRPPRRQQRSRTPWRRRYATRAEAAAPAFCSSAILQIITHTLLLW